jgi:hypothetical protein
MLSFVIIHSIEMGSLANGYESISGRAWYVIVIKRHRVMGRLIVLVSSFPPILGDVLFGVAIFT